MPQAVSANTTRRALFAAAAALPSFAAMPLGAHAAAPEIYRLMERRDYLENLANTCATNTATEAAALQELFELEEHLYRLPCDSASAAVAKLTVIGFSFDRGERTDESEPAVLAEVIAYLRGRG